MKTDMKRKGSLLILAAGMLLAALLASCGSTQEPSGSDASSLPPEEAPESGTETQEPGPDLPERDYDGYTFTLFMRNDDYYIADIYTAEMNGDVLNDVIYERNAKVAEQFNIAYTLVKSSNFMGSDADKAILAGDDAYDLILPHGRASFGYGYKGLALDWNTDLPYVHLDSPWWNDDARTQFSICGTLYQMVCDIGYQNFGRTVAMLFNTDLFDTYNLDYPYRTVLDGKWTFDEFARIAKLVTEDLNGDSAVTPDADLIGYVTYYWNGPGQALKSAGQRVAELNQDRELTLTLNNPKTVEMYEKYFELTDSDSGHIAKVQADAEKIFREGRALFGDSMIDAIMNLRDMDDNFGIIPWPKLDESMDTYPSTTGAGNNMLVVPITASDPERTSIILEALSYEDYKMIIPTYYDIVVQNKYSRDTDSLRMLELIYEDRVYDVGSYFDNTIFNTPLQSIGQTLADSSDRSFASCYAKHEAATLAIFDRINQTYRDLTAKK